MDTLTTPGVAPGRSIGDASFEAPRAVTARAVDVRAMLRDAGERLDAGH